MICINADFLYLADNIEDLNNSSLTSRSKFFTLDDIFYCEYSKTNNDLSLSEEKLFEYGIADTDLSVFIKHMNDIEKSEVFKDLEIKPLLRIGNINNLIEVAGGKSLFKNEVKKKYCALYYSITKNNVEYASSDNIEELSNHNLLNQNYKLEYLFSFNEILNILEKFNDIFLRRGINEEEINEIYIFNSRNIIQNEIDYDDLGQYIDVRNSFVKRLSYLKGDFEEFTKVEKLDFLLMLKEQVSKVEQNLKNKYLLGNNANLENIIKEYSLGRVSNDTLLNIRKIYNFNYMSLEKIDIYVAEVLMELNKEENKYK